MGKRPAAGATTATPAERLAQIRKERSQSGISLVSLVKAACCVLVGLALWRFWQWLRIPTQYLMHQPVARLNASAPGALKKFFERYHGRDAVVIENALDGWPAMQWTFSSLAERCPKAHLPVYSYDVDTKEWAALRQTGYMPLRDYFTDHFGRPYNGPTDEYGNPKKYRWERHKIEAEARDAMEKKDLLYALEMSLRNECPMLLEDIRIPAFFADDMLVRYYKNAAWPTLITGPRGTQSGLHRDTHNLPFYMALFSGRKRWRIFHDDDAVLQEYYIAERNGYAFNPFAPDFAKYPRLGEVKVQDLELKAGELLYIPPGAPHAAFNMEDTLAISGNYLDKKGLLQFTGVTCEQKLWSDSRLCWAYMNDFEKHASPPLEELREKSFFEFAGHKGPKSWCTAFLPELRDRAAKYRAENRPEDLFRCVPTVEEYCSNASERLVVGEIADYERS
eukprot:gnl/TRDRNA2_/TRDRNA2_185651_c0_seq1.p1 gnl/TRDRNA2_/TRDRNA2_185651_c0~~gnl/TRDRNA2_/TRDRNA2_185651_c0_seq1.p1  ORF type:complete len:449 (-),score=73.51 gnl/TRDRNA2_/TRDRNA2_185651_c0_seq1:61-1407(-)